MVPHAPCFGSQDPVDLTLIASRLEGGRFYTTLDIFLADFKRMFTNCR